MSERWRNGGATKRQYGAAGATEEREIARNAPRKGEPHGEPRRIRDPAHKKRKGRAMAAFPVSVYADARR